MNREDSKILVLFTLLILTLVASLLPVKFIRSKKALYVSNRRRQKKLISLLSCFGGGVFFATCLLDLFPEVKAKFVQVSQIEHLKLKFPVAEFTLSVGFFVVLVIEQIALAVKESHEVERPGLIANENGDTNNSDYGATSSADDRSVNQDDLEQSMHTDKSSHSKLRSILLVGALSTHSVFEGLAIGLQSNADDVISVFAAVLIHKTILAFSLGLNLAQSALSLSSIIESIVVFVITSPIGIAVGIAVMNLASGSGPIIASGILQGIACGTFLFVTFFEILPHEFNQSKDRILKLFFVLLGFTCITIVVLFHPSVPNPI